MFLSCHFNRLNYEKLTWTFRILYETIINSVNNNLLSWTFQETIICQLDVNEGLKSQFYPPIISPPFHQEPKRKLWTQNKKSKKILEDFFRRRKKKIPLGLKKRSGFWFEAPSDHLELDRCWVWKVNVLGLGTQWDER